MECTFTASRLKEFVRALRCLSTFGDELNITATTEEFKLSAVSASRSAFALISFDTSFFSKYHLFTRASPQPGPSSSRKPSPPAAEAVQISVTVRTLSNALGKRATTTTVENVALSIVFDEQVQDQLSSECRLILRLYCKHGVIKTHRLTFAAETALTPLFDRSSCTSHWVVSSLTLDEWINHFSTSKRTGTEEISLLCAGTYCKLKSYEPASGNSSVDARDRDELANRAVSTAVHVDTEEFDEYRVQGEEVLTFGLKEFKAMIHFGKEAGCALEADYLSGGQPLMTSIRGDFFYADFVLATSGDDPAEVKSEPVPQPKLRSNSRAPSKQPSRPTSAQPQSRAASAKPPDVSKQPSTKRAVSSEQQVAKEEARQSSAQPQQANGSRTSHPPAPLPSMSQVDRELHEHMIQQEEARLQQKPLFRPSPSPTPTPALQAAPKRDSAHQEEPQGEEADLQAQMDADDYVIPDSEMNEAFEQWTQRQTTQQTQLVGQHQEPEHDPQPPLLSQDSQATQDSDDEALGGRQLKKAKWQLFD